MKDERVEARIISGFLLGLSFPLGLGGFFIPSLELTIFASAILISSAIFYKKG